MSLQALPTELDVLIFDYLGSQEKSRLARVSKAYYKTGIPLLYQSLRFYQDEFDKVTYLLMTLLRCGDLSKHIENFELQFRTTDDIISQAPKLPVVSKAKDLDDQLKSYSYLIKQAIHRTDVPKFEKINWIQRIIKLDPKLDYILALTVRLLAPVINLTLAIDKDPPLHLTQTVLRTPVPPCIGTTSAAAGQALAKNLRVESSQYERNRFHTAVWPGLEQLVVKGCDPLIEVQSAASVKRLEIDFCRDVTSFLMPLLQDGAFRKLDSLIVHGAQFQWKLYVNFDHFKDCAAKYLSALREFVWIDTSDLHEVMNVTPFGSFVSLTKLEILRIDYSLFPARYCGRTMPKFAFPNFSPNFDRLPDYLPPSIRTFEVHGLDWRTAGFPFPADLDAQSGGQAHNVSVARTLHDKLPHLQELIFTIDMDHPDFHQASEERPMYLDDKIIPYWREVADVLVQYGVHFKVQYFTDPSRAPMHILVQPGFSTLKIWPEKVMALWRTLLFVKSITKEAV